MIDTSTPHHSLDSERRLICICVSEGRVNDKVSSEMLYNVNIQKIYATMEKQGTNLNTDTDFVKYGLDVATYFECMETDALFWTEMPKVASTIADLYNRRTQINQLQQDIKKMEDLTISVSAQDGVQEDFNDLMDDLTDIQDGKYELLHTPWYRLQNDSRFTEGKSICFIVGDPGSGKSFFVAQMVGYWVENGMKVINWQGENTSKFHARRSIAQWMGNSNLCDYEWMTRNANEVRMIYNQNKEHIDKIMGSLYTSKDLSKENLIRWCWEKAREGYQAVVVDPFTFFSGGEKSHLDDQIIMTELNEIIKQYNIRFIIVTHPRSSGGSAISLDEIAGARNLSRFCQNAIWISRGEGSERTFYNLKTRNGQREFGGKVRMNFDSKTVRFEECHDGLG